VRSLLIVMAYVDVEHPLQMSATQDEQPVETFSPDCPDPPFRVGVRPGRPHRRPENPNAFTLEDVVKGLREFAVAVAHEEPDVSCRLRPLEGKVSGLLRDPRAVRMRCAAAEVHAEHCLGRHQKGTPGSARKETTDRGEGEPIAFMLSQIYTPGVIEEFVDLVVPELQRRGRYRQDYTGTTQRDHLMQER
jgi:hypothetical protein